MNCHFCGTELIWNCDYTCEEFGYDIDGIVAILTCPNCNAEWIGTLSFEEE